MQYSEIFMVQCTSFIAPYALIKEYSLLAQVEPEMRTLEKVSVTVSSNIHLNSFMYEPILDLTIDHLVDLYKGVNALNE